MVQWRQCEQRQQSTDWSASAAGPLFARVFLGDSSQVGVARDRQERRRPEEESSASSSPRRLFSLQQLNACGRKPGGRSVNQGLDSNRSEGQSVVVGSCGQQRKQRPPAGRPNPNSEQHVSYPDAPWPAMALVHSTHPDPCTHQTRTQPIASTMIGGLARAVVPRARPAQQVAK